MLILILESGWCRNIYAREALYYTNNTTYCHDGAEEADVMVRCGRLAKRFRWEESGSVGNVETIGYMVPAANRCCLIIPRLASAEGWRSWRGAVAVTLDRDVKCPHVQANRKLMMQLTHLQDGGRTYSVVLYPWRFVTRHCQVPEAGKSSLRGVGGHEWRTMPG